MSPLPTRGQAGERVCLGPGCEQTFEPAGPHEQYCSPICQDANNALRRGRDPRPVPAAPQPPPQPTMVRLVVERRQRCGRCQVDHDVYTLAGQPA